MVKCVGYQPAPVGVSPAFGYRWAHFPENYEGDLALLEGLGANAVAVNTRSAAEPHELRTFMTRALDHGMRTILVVNGPNGQDASDPEVREWFLDGVDAAVAEYADHPGLLFWWLGNEVDYLYPNPSRVGDWYALLDEAALRVHDADPNHPVLTSNNPRTDEREFMDGSPNVDVFGINFYVSSHERARHDLRNMSGVTEGWPIFVTEFGSDAWNNATNEEDEATQAKVVADVWDAMTVQRTEGNPILGGCVHEWSDQWWKVGSLDEQDPEPAWPSPEKGVLPDDGFSEEWFGLVRIQPGSMDRDPREAYFRLAEKWGGTAAPKG